MGRKIILYNDLDACRSLDLIIECIGVLKAALRAGFSLDGKGEQKLSWKAIWCPDISWTPESTMSNIEDAKLALRRMKDAKRAIDSLSTSLDDVINAVSGPVIQDSREVGLANLPDDVLAHIFEICFLVERELGYELPASPYEFPSVCRRFRDIVIHLPLLWQNISQEFSKNSFKLLAYTGRCQHSWVYIPEDRRIPLDGFLDCVAPYHQWEELHLRFINEEDGHKIFDTLNPEVHLPFTTLKTLSVWNYGQRSGGEAPAIHSLLEVDNLSLISWQFPTLTRLIFRNILPSANMSCPNVTRFEIVFDTQFSEFVAWDFLHFRDFLQSISKLESLMISFENHDKQIAFINMDGPVVPLKIPSLSSLELILCDHPPLLAVGSVIDLIETEHLTKLSIDVWQSKHHAPWSEKRFRSSPFILWGSVFIGDWMPMVFACPGHWPRNTRPFPSVSDFSLKIETPSYLHHPPFNYVFAALPNVQHLSLKLPDYVDIDLGEWKEKYGGLQELRSLRIDEYPSSIPAKYTTFFSKISKSESWRLFEKLEVVSPSRGSFRVEALEEHLGEKLVRIGGVQS